MLNFSPITIMIEFPKTPDYDYITKIENYLTEEITNKFINNIFNRRTNRNTWLFKNMATYYDTNYNDNINKTLLTVNNSKQYRNISIIDTGITLQVVYEESIMLRNNYKILLDKKGFINYSDIIISYNDNDEIEYPRRAFSQSFSQLLYDLGA